MDVQTKLKYPTKLKNPRNLVAKMLKCNRLCQPGQVNDCKEIKIKQNLQLESKVALFLQCFDSSISVVILNFVSALRLLYLHLDRLDYFYKKKADGLPGAPRKNARNIMPAKIMMPKSAKPNTVFFATIISGNQATK